MSRAISQDPKLFSADVGDFFGPVTEAAVVAIRDVLLCPTGGGGDGNDYTANPPVAAPLLRRIEHSAPPAAELGRGLHIDRLDDDEAERVFKACTPRGHYFAPIKQFGQRYSFIRGIELSEWQDHPYHWDRDGVIYDALAMSRLVRDHAFSMEHAARIIDYSDGVQVISWRPGSIGAQAYTVRHERDWLSYAEAEELSRLLEAYWSVRDNLPPRVARAMWRAEYAASIRWGDVILPTLVSDLEALLKTDRRYATRQFKERATHLAAELGIASITEPWCEGIYDARSDWVHGSRVELFARDPHLGGGPASPTQSDVFGDIARVQDLLRAAVRRAIEDETFRETFATAESVRERWPVRGRA